MSNEAWIMVIGIALANLFTLAGGLVHITTRLTRIETDLAWVKRNCPKCPLILDRDLT